MIDPKNITNFNLTASELEEHILFWICAAGKNGVTASKCLDKFLTYTKAGMLFDKKYDNMLISEFQKLPPFEVVRHYKSVESLAHALKNSGIGCFTTKAAAFWEIANANIDLKICTVDELEVIKGIGPKTARCFIMHSRPNQQLAGLDRHILRFLSDKGYNVPTTTPTGAKYKQVEQIFLKEAKKAGKSIAELDLEVWNNYRNK